MTDEPSEPSKPKIGGPFAAFRYPNYRCYASARFLATTAVQMQSVAVGYQLYDLTKKPIVLGLVGLAQFLPVFLLTLPAGQAADRLNRRRLLIACDLLYIACALALALLTRAGLTSPAAVYGVLVLFGVARAFYAPASQSLVPTLVSREDFGNAIAWNSTLWPIAAIGGPAVGAAIYAAASPTAVYLSSAGAFACAIVALLFLKPPPTIPAKKAADLKTVLAGLRYVWRVKMLLGSISLNLFAVFLGGAVALVPIFAARLNVGVAGVGWMRAAPAVGAGLMALTLAFRPIRGGAGVKMFAAVFVFGAATVVFGLSNNFALSIAALVVLGAADMVSVVVRQTLEQAVTPQAMRGRVSAVSMLFVGASNELGDMESGSAAELLGPVGAVLLGGFGTMAVVIAWAFMFPSLRSVDRADLVEPQEGDDADER